MILTAFDNLCYSIIVENRGGKRMKRNQKGFTLIELLAVIVILAIIALIATPMVLKYIETSREGAAESDAYAAMKAAELYYAEKVLSNEGAPSTVEASELDLKNNGVSGTISFPADKSGEATVSSLTVKVNGTDYTCDFNTTTEEFDCHKANA